ncbi:U-actitoxin-Avd3k-like [Saccostrea echinata]|uniref:U-actitoxin-Avd3k-like n=1 Tax=Saccostrea echinata TaxID=191078 RepID=UPI002A802E6B|nr:U-actitoxin-Avd3k-like [Saccostrea echinata]
MQWFLCCLLTLNISLVTCYLGITYNLKDCMDIPPVRFCGKVARIRPPIVLYFYHSSNGQCEPFLWSDCPNAHSKNLFQSKSECETVCKDPLTVIDINQEMQ